jgi:hypothetical protein
MPPLLFDIAIFDISLQLASYGLATCLQVGQLQQNIAHELTHSSQDYHAGLGMSRIFIDVLRVILLLPVVRLIEFGALVFTIACPPQGFDTIAK